MSEKRAKVAHVLSNSFEARIKQVNERLKVAKLGVSIQQVRSRLYLLATLPPKPSSGRQKWHQQRIATKKPANNAGLAAAEDQARLVGALLVNGRFDWAPYLPTREPVDTRSVGFWLRQFEENRRDTIQPGTWRSEYRNVFSQLDRDSELTIALLEQAILQTRPNTRQRLRFCRSLELLAQFAGLDAKFDRLQGNYSLKAVEPRDLPSDEEIAAVWGGLDCHAGWKWVYGAIAVFGLRGHEAFYLDTEALTQGKNFVLVKEGKTGAHQVWAYHPEWVDLFNLRSPILPPVSGKEHEDFGRRVSVFFKRSAPFRAYDLRHCWAVRTLRYGLDVTLAAQQMGHSVEVHHRVYHRWINASIHEAAYERSLSRSDRPTAPLNPPG